ncbi:uroporphyrinogen-III C-methyltransferase [bacterium]|nr:uroporphyrinogen-III C-methyltransferase [bacterium]
MADKLKKTGKVYLIGAGPGDPELITLRGMELLRRCDVIVTDRLANPALLSHIKHGAQIIYAGKESRDHTLSQYEINATLIEQARQGRMVARLKGGDPFVFGRGGEEAIALAEAGIEFEVVPGISSSVAAAAYAGIPVTHRFLASSFAVITGHESPDKQGSDIKWDKISTGVDTLVFLMGIENLPHIVESLIANGRDPKTPVAVIQWGTCPSQRTVTGTLDDIVQKCESEQISPPAVTVVGEVVKLRDTISWFEKKPLFGKRILVTRAKHQAGELTEKLHELGADVVEIPVIKIIRPPDYDIIDAALERTFDWIIFTSVNGVCRFMMRLNELKKDIRILGSAKLAAIGSETADTLRMFQLMADYVPSEYVAEEFIKQFLEDVKGKSILIPRALKARDTIPDGLRAMGAEVIVAPVYETVTNHDCAEDLRAQLLSKNLDIITFTSSSTVESFIELAGDLELSKDIKIACIGPITAKTARAHGLEPDIIAEDYTIEGLVQALIAK